MSAHKPKPFTLEELRAYLIEVFPQVWTRSDYSIEEVGSMSATVLLHHHPDHLRPGGTISGPSMFALCDLALYVAILHEIGRVKLAVTTNVSINSPAQARARGSPRQGEADEVLASGWRSARWRSIRPDMRRWSPTRPAPHSIFRRVATEEPRYHIPVMKGASFSSCFWGESGDRELTFCMSRA